MVRLLWIRNLCVKRLAELSLEIFSLEEAYEALRTFEILGVEKQGDVSAATCPSVTSVLGSSSAPKELFYALKVNSILKCNVDDASFEVFRALCSRSLSNFPVEGC